jgi:hypothetical protein
MTQETTQEQIVVRAMKDRAFRYALLSNPRFVLEREYNVHLPENVAVHVLEEAPNSFTLVLPAREEAIVELTDADLQVVTGAGEPRCASDSLCCRPPSVR